MSVRQAIELDEHGNICIPSGRDETAIREMFHCVQSANSAVHSAEAKLRDEVDRLRNEGVSWSVIGLLLGMSRGGAQKKFSKPMIRVSADALREAMLETPSGQLWWTPESGRQSSPAGEMASSHVTELLDGLTAEMSDRTVVKHLSRGGPTVQTLDALSYLENQVRLRDLSLPGRSYSESEKLIRKAALRLRM